MRTTTLFLLFVTLFMASCSSLLKEEKETTPLYPYVENNRVGFLDEQLNKKIPPQFAFRANKNWPYSFSEGLAAISINGKAGYISRDGSIAIEPAFEEAHNFSNGLALVRSGGLYGYINKRGKYEIEPRFADAGSFHSELARVKEQSGRWGFIDSDG
ncbi:MAG TPA: WG repeat-containing protein, partial [Halalkalibaculum sp.]|nr:WG repeat-containing protein [Halalkalibaculum sp.]